MTDADRARVERLLAEAARGAAYPPPPALRARVLASLAAERARAGGRPAVARGRRRTVLTAVAALVAAFALAAVAAIPPARTAVAEFFGLVAGERIERGAVVPSNLPAPARPDQFARPAGLTEAAAALGAEVPLPADYGTPEGIFIVAYGGHPLVILQYPTFDLWETRGESFVVVKRVPADAILSIETVRGRPAYWIESRAYEVRFFGPDGVEVLGARRTVDRHALIWRGEELYYRIETELPLGAARDVAASLP
ncbi:MAG: hypothetical protein WEB13_07020 [Dehalococcoidia bacterium]